MSNKWRRFEVLLPLRFNDGREVSPEWIAEAILSLDTVRNHIRFIYEKLHVHSKSEAVAKALQQHLV